MKKKIKISLILSLAIILGCFSNVFAATNQNNKADKISQVRKNARFLDSTTTSSSTQSEEVDQYTKLLMHMDNGTFKDECGHTVTNNGVTLGTATKKFGNGSASFNGSNGYLAVSNNSDFDFGNSDFTIDLWIKLNNLSNTNRQDVFAKATSWTNNSPSNNTWGLYLQDNHIRFYISDGAYWYTLQSNNTIADLNWHHLALVRNGNDYRIYLDGNNINYIVYRDPNTKVVSSIPSNISIPSLNTPIGIGDFGVTLTNYFNGYIDELRISNVARWTSDFTPPTNPYGNVLATGITLNKTTDTLPVGQTDNTLVATVTPDNVTNKTVKWTSSDPTIVSVDLNTGVMTAGTTPGTVTITATTTDGSNLSASCTVTVQDSEPSKSKLIIYMGNQVTREYYLTDDEINDFINWYDARANDKTPKSYYVFNVPAQGVLPARKDYVLFDKIKAFEVE